MRRGVWDIAGHTLGVRLGDDAMATMSRQVRRFIMALKPILRGAPLMWFNSATDE
jgi:hypothetical protein